MTYTSKIESDLPPQIHLKLGIESDLPPKNLINCCIESDLPSKICIYQCSKRFNNTHFDAIIFVSDSKEIR